MAAQLGRRERRANRTLLYVEPLSNAKTKLAGFFNILRPLTRASCQSIGNGGRNFRHHAD